MKTSAVIFFGCEMKAKCQSMLIPQLPVPLYMVWSYPCGVQHTVTFIPSAHLSPSSCRIKLGGQGQGWSCVVTEMLHDIAPSGLVQLGRSVIPWSGDAKSEGDSLVRRRLRTRGRRLSTLFSNLLQNIAQNPSITRMATS